MSTLTLPARDAAAASRVKHFLGAASSVVDAAVAHLGLGAAFLLRHEGAHDERAIRGTLDAITKGTQSPAMTTVPEWAGALVPDTVLALIDLLGQEGNAVAQLPFARFAFNGRGKLRVPLRMGTLPNLAGHFRAEGGAIRVGALSLTSAPLEPKTMAVIATSTEEMAQAAGDDVLEAVIRSGSIADTSRTLDSLFFDAQPASAERPAGLAALATDANTAVSTGTDAAAIAADLRARYDQLLANGYGGSNTRWVMNSTHAATLVETFIEVQTRDTYLRIPIVAEPTVPAGTVFLIDCASVVVGADQPKFDAATAAIVHEEAEPDAVSEDVAAAAPVRSLFQTAAVGFRTVWPLDWAAAPGGVQTVTGVAW